MSLEFPRGTQLLARMLCQAGCRVRLSAPGFVSTRHRHLLCGTQTLEMRQGLCENSGDHKAALVNAGEEGREGASLLLLPLHSRQTIALEEV